MESVIVCTIDLVFISRLYWKVLNSIVVCHGCGKK
jgi:hypothetical protein